MEFDQVAMRYGRGPVVLHDVSFELSEGSFHFLTGPSGAGKSSLLRLLNLSQLPTMGRVRLFGRDVAATPRSERPALRRKIGVVFQDFRLIEHLTAVENAVLPLRVAGSYTRESENQVRELLAWVGLGDHLQALPRAMSGGQQQRVAIARAVIARPHLLLADEPTGNVDDATAARLMYLFEELNKMGTTVVIATHADGLIRRFDHPVLRLAGGTLTVEPPRRARGAA